MPIACLYCATSYFVEPTSLLQRNGRRVRRCVCRNGQKRVAWLTAAAEDLAPETLVANAVVAQWPPNSAAAPAQSPDAPAEAAGDPTNEAPDAGPVGQAAAQGAPGEPEPAEATAGVGLDATDPHPGADDVRFGCRRLTRDRAAVAADRLTVRRDRPATKPAPPRLRWRLDAGHRRDPIAGLR